ncbi:energy transducer TonB [Pseudophaeobacter sp.]|uniref:energy transducer TonB n=1 Tax=Pseudophaeobacter sp. TaxID=1971739 RepID=UPI0032988536
MQTGTKISLAGHGLLVGWAAFGAWFSSDPLPFQVQEVAVISAEEFARLSQQIQAPEVTENPSALPPPEDPTTQPQVSQRPERRPEVTAPEAVTAPSIDTPATTLPEPQPEPEIAAEIPQPPQQPDTNSPATPSIVPVQPAPEQLRPADRVAPVPVEAPEPEVTIDDLVQPEVAPDAGAESEQEVQEATAPEAASDRIVTEANESDEATPTVPVTAPSTSVRPKTRPRRPAPSETAAETPAADPETNQRSAIEDALAAAIAGGGEVAAPEPSGPPLTAGEKDALRVSVSKCWNVGSLSSEALKTTVEVSVSLQQNGKIVAGSVRMVSSTGGSAGAAKQAYEAARRAIIRCGAKGFQLPSEKYGHWRDIVMTFNPEKMRIK